MNVHTHTHKGSVNQSGYSQHKSIICANHVVLRQWCKWENEESGPKAERELKPAFKGTLRISILEESTPVEQQRCTGCLRHRQLAQSYQRLRGSTCAQRRR